MLTVLADMPIEPYERWALDLIAHTYTAANPRYSISGPTGGVLAEGAWAISPDIHGPVPASLDMQAAQAAEVLESMRRQFLEPYGIRWAAELEPAQKARWLALAALAWHRPAAVARATENLDPFEADWPTIVRAVGAPERKGLEKAARSYLESTPAAEPKRIPWAAIGTVAGLIGTGVTIVLLGRRA
jgi:hypothetical protein